MTFDTQPSQRENLEYRETDRNRYRFKIPTHLATTAGLQSQKSKLTGLITARTKAY